MARSRNLPLLLVLLGLSLVALLLSRGGLGPLSGGLADGVGSPAGPTAGASPVGAAASGETDTQAARSPAFPDVNLESLDDQRAAVAGAGRNPFLLAAERRPDLAPPPSPSGPGPGPLPSLPGPAATGPVSGSARLDLKFIGIVNLPNDAGKLAVLSDGDFVYHGRTGDVLEGRYRIVGIGDESVELEMTDGAGRQVLPLSGS